MADHIVTSFDQAMASLSDALGTIAERAADQLRSAIDALDRRDGALADQVQASDAEIDALDDEIEDRVIKILALRSPFAVDLRETIAALRMAREFERIGDYAKNIAKRAPAFFGDPPSSLDRDIVDMGRAVVGRLDDLARAYRTRKADLALAIWESDEEIDEYCNRIFDDVLTSMSSNPVDVAAGAHKLFVAKNLERIGDHATNVAESVRFILTGVKMRESRPKSDRTSGVVGVRP